MNVHRLFHDSMKRIPDWLPGRSSDHHDQADDQRRDSRADQGQGERQASPRQAERTGRIASQRA